MVGATNHKQYGLYPNRLTSVIKSPIFHSYQVNKDKNIDFKLVRFGIIEGSYYINEYGRLTKFRGTGRMMHENTSQGRTLGSPGLLCRLISHVCHSP